MMFIRHDFVVFLIITLTIQKQFVSLQNPNTSYMQYKNIFGGYGQRTQFVNLIYQELMKRRFVSNADILCIYYGREIDYYDRKTYSSEAGYQELKKAFSDVVRALKETCPGKVIDNGKKGKGKAYKYTGEVDDPFADERKAVVQKSLEDYVTFCKASAGIVPASWFSSFFENTQLLLEAHRATQDGTAYIASSLGQNLTNIHLLPLFHQAITDKKVLRFSYQRYGQDPFELTFHPQFLKEYNGRWFVFGETNREPYHAYNVPLDRIVGDIAIIEDAAYIPAEKGFYQEFFKNIIGVTHEKDAKVEQVVIRTKTEYQHGLLLTKPLHHSQHETLPFGEHPDGCYGEVKLTIEPNRKLQGKILMYGENLEVMQPQTLRKQIRDIIKQQMEFYLDQ